MPADGSCGNLEVTGRKSSSSVQPFAHRSAGFSPSLLFLRVFSLAFCSLIYRFSYNTFFPGVSRSILSRIARSPAPAAPSSSRPDPAELHLPRPHPSLQPGPASRSPPDPRTAFGHRGRRGLSGALNGLPLLEFSRAFASLPQNPSRLSSSGPIGQGRGYPGHPRPGTAPRLTGFHPWGALQEGRPI